jgi:hypothetical protein
MVDKSLRKYTCNICNKDYASSGSLWGHNNKFHNINTTKSVNIVNENVNKIVNKNVNSVNTISKSKYSCTKCLKSFSCRQGRYQHEKKCNLKINPCTLIEENIQLNEENKKLKSQIINNNSNINNGTINNNIIINQIGKESIDCLKIKDILSIANDRLNGPITCIKKLNFNKSLPQNHSFCSTSLEGNYFTTVNHKTQKTEKISKKDLIHKVLNSSLDFIEGIALHLELNKDYQNKIPTEYQEKIQFILDNKYKFYEKKNLLIFGNSINSMSYNYKDLILSTWELLQPLEDDTSSEYSEPDIKEVTHFSSDEEDEY